MAIVDGSAAKEEASETVSSDADESWDEEEDYDYDSHNHGCQAGGGGGGGGRSETLTPAKQAQLQRLHSRINFDFLPDTRTKMSHAVQNSAVRSEKKAATARNLGLTQDTRATVEQVLDPRTMLVLSKFLKRGLLKEIHGCISTGKEANVYYATGEEGRELAVKVYKTSILVFKDRNRYVEGDYRFRKGYSKNPRKMVAQWAEKEMRNLKRIQAAGIKCPSVLEVRQNVLVMEFLGEDGDAAPRLKDAIGVDAQEWAGLYRDCVLTMRRLMQECKLVHGDLSEYNMLLHDRELFMIDVSQSTENDHPQALDFLKRDCVNVNNFFSKVMAGAPLRVKKLFDFVVTKELKTFGSEGSDEEVLQTLLTEASKADEVVDDEVFMQTWIPSNLSQVNDRAFMERDIALRARGEELLYARLLPDAKEERQEEQLEEEDADNTDTDAAPDVGASTTSAAPAAPADAAAPTADNKESDAEEASDAEDSSSDGDDDAREEKNDGRRPDGVDKATWKAQVKAEKAEKRKEKCPKALKKKYRKQAAKGR